jgi:quinol monooxygenase YgiN
MIHVIATITLQPGTRSTFLEHFHRLEPLVRAEDGCLEYGASVDVPSGLTAQQPLRPDVVIVVEKWSSLPALEAHLEAPHMTAYRVAVKEYIIDTTLQVLAPPRPKAT